MGSSLRHLASVVRVGCRSSSPGRGVVGCSAISRCGRAPPVDAPCRSRECYPSVEMPLADGLAASMAAWSQVPPTCPHPLQVLALSGGVAGAPFTAGVLTGWTKSGTRPMFDQVSGISSGSLIGAFAFLGPQYDEKMRSLILSLHTSDLIRFHPLCCWSGMARSAPRSRRSGCSGPFSTRGSSPTWQGPRRGTALFRRHHEPGDQAIGNLGCRGHRVERPGGCGRPGRKVLLAAISWPGTVPPVEFDVEVDGRCYHEQHCDAGSVAMTFVRFGAARLARAGRRPGWAGWPARTCTFWPAASCIRTRCRCASCPVPHGPLHIRDF